MQIKPQGSYLVVLPDAPEETTESGLYVPESSRQKPLRGVIKAVGPGSVEDKMEFQVGELVAYGQFAGIPVDWDGVQHLIMKASDIFYTYTE